MPARVGVGAAVGYLLLGPVGGVGGAIAGSMYTLERNPGPGFLALGKQFAINFPNGYGVVAKWGGKTAFSRYTNLATTLPSGDAEGDVSQGWGPGNFARHANKVAKRRKTVRSMVGLAEKAKPRSIKSLGPGIVSKGPNFSIVFENGWAVRVDPEGLEPLPTSGNVYNYAKTATVFLYTPGGELVETMEAVTPVRLAAMLEKIAMFKAAKPVRKRRGNKPAPIKGEFQANPKKAPTAAALKSECRRLWEHYCERPNKTRLRAVIKHCDLMAESSAKSVKEERARCMRSARREMKKLGMK